MTLQDKISEIVKIHNELHEMCLKHLKSCEKCLNREYCAEEKKFMFVIETIEPVYYDSITY